MPLTCSICGHPQRSEIETALISRVALRRIASQFSTSDATLRRHKQNCMPAAIEQAQASQQAQTAEIVEAAEERRTGFVWNALNKMEWLDRQVTIVYTEARVEKDHNAALKALGEIRQQTKLFSELLSGMEPGQKEKMEEEWVAVREAIYEALEAHPEARLSVARALLRLGRGDDGNDNTTLSSNGME